VSDAGKQLVIDRAKCCGHGRCYTLAPHLIDSDDDGLPVLPISAVPAEMLSDARRAVGGCPELALELVEASDEELESRAGRPIGRTVR
jgi:ferredoxin